MTNDIPLPFDLPAVRRKKLTVDFDGGTVSSNGGLLLLRAAERQLGVCRRLADAMPDRRDPERVRHAMFEMVMARAAAIACGHEDAIDLDRLRHDPLMKVAVGRCPETGAALASQSTISRLENAPSKSEATRLSAALLDQFGTTVRPGRLEVLDIDDTFCAAHGGQQLAFWNAHEDEPRLRIDAHLSRGEWQRRWRPSCRPARTPEGHRGQDPSSRHVTKRLRRGIGRRPVSSGAATSHYGRVEAMEWAEDNGIDYIFGLAGNTTLDALVAETAANLRFHHAGSSEAKLRTYASVVYQAGSWTRLRKVVARLECSLQPDARSDVAPGLRQEVDIRYVVTSLKGTAQHLYEGHLLSARPNGKSHQITQGPARLGPHVVSPRHRQSGAARAPHRRLLADARCARRDPVDQSVGERRVRHHPRAPDQDRCACDRAHRTHSASSCRRVVRSARCSEPSRSA